MGVDLARVDLVCALPFAFLALPMYIMRLWSMLRGWVGPRERGMHERNNTWKEEEKREKEYPKISGK